MIFSKAPTAQSSHSTPEVELLNVKQVAALLNCSQRHVFRLAETGQMPSPIKLGQLVRWNRSTLDQWIANGCESVR